MQASGLRAQGCGPERPGFASAGSPPGRAPQRREHAAPADAPALRPETSILRPSVTSTPPQQHLESGRTKHVHPAVVAAQTRPFSAMIRPSERSRMSLFSNSGFGDLRNSKDNDMTTRATSNVTCGNCGKRSDQAIVYSTNEFGPPDLDLRPPEGKRSTMDTWPQVCPACGHVAEELEEEPEHPSILTEERDVSALASPDHPPLARRFLARAVAAEAATDSGSAGARCCVRPGPATTRSGTRRRRTAGAGRRRRWARWSRRTRRSSVRPCGWTRCDAQANRKKRPRLATPRWRCPGWWTSCGPSCSSNRSSSPAATPPPTPSTNAKTTRNASGRVAGRLSVKRARLPAVPPLAAASPPRSLRGSRNLSPPAPRPPAGSTGSPRGGRRRPPRRRRPGAARRRWAGRPSTPPRGSR